MPVHGNFISNVLKPKIIQISINRWVNKSLYIYTMAYYSVIKMNKLLIYATIDESQNTYAK